jgi:hypothetical protein
MFFFLFVVYKSGKFESTDVFYNIKKRSLLYLFVTFCYFSRLFSTLRNTY